MTTFDSPIALAHPVNRRAVFLVRLVMLLLVCLTVLSSAAFSGPRRARLSEDVTRFIAANRPGEIQVIVPGDAARLRQLATRHGLRLVKSMRSGALLSGRVDQLDALATEPEVGIIAANQRVYGMMATTTAAVGADQVLAGVEGVARFSGRGIGIAVIDSGITEHRDLRGRVVASVDFASPYAGGLDLYGHGTHMAGIIAGSGAASPAFRGVAPGAHLINLRVHGRRGNAASRATSSRRSTGPSRTASATRFASSTSRSVTP